MTDMEQWNKENDAFLALIGQVAKATPKPVSKKDGE
jgi:hypothetical protein